MQIPYTYFLIFTNPINNQIKFYYGSKVAKDADPSLLWMSYFTSSKIIKDLISQFGKDSFKPSVRRIFTPISDSEEDIQKSISRAKNLENKILRKYNVRNNPNWINESINTFGDYYAFYKTIEHKAKLGMKGDRNPSKRPEVRAKISKSKTGKKLSENHRKNISIGHIGQKPWNAGIQWSDEQKKNLKSEVRIKAMSENRKKGQEKWKNSKHSKESKKQISDSISEYFKNNPDEMKRRAQKVDKISKGNKIREMRKGKIWIVNSENVSKSISPEELEKFKNLGFIRGKKFKKLNS